MTSLKDLRTPALIVDLERVEANAARMQENARRMGARLRPHVKTHKTLEAARIQTRDGFQGITVSTLAEAEFFKAGGFDDITYAFPITAAKLPAVAEIQDGIDFHIVVDHPAQIRAVEHYAERHRMRFSVLLEIDCGYGRSGVPWHTSRPLRLARRLDDSRHTAFQGLITHAGQSYAAPNPPKITKIARKEQENLGKLLQRLQEVDIDCPTVSVGSTPTCSLFVEELEAANEIRPGNYIFYDRTQADLQSCRPEDCAVSVLSTVVSHYPGRNEMLIDAGALALSKDRGLVRDARQEIVYGVGLDHPHLRVESISQEHGIVGSKNNIDFHQFPIGTRLRIIPNHSCLTAAGFPEYHVFDTQGFKEVWKPVRGW
ncbi:MAG TPA: alanine racemase [Acidobacteriota bacterium]|nr:alanine racemase [Acidobacteriota bacterium]